MPTKMGILHKVHALREEPGRIKAIDKRSGKNTLKQRSGNMRWT